MNELLSAYCLPRERSVRSNIIRVNLSVRRYKSVNSFSIAHLVVFQRSLFVTLGTCNFHAAVLVWSYCTCLIVLSGLGTLVSQMCLCRMLHLSGASLSDVVEIDGRPTSIAPSFSFDPVDSGNIVDVCLSCKIYNTDRIACILCMHLGACRFFTHSTA